MGETLSTIFAVAVVAAFPLYFTTRLFMQFRENTQEKKNMPLSRSSRGARRDGKGYVAAALPPSPSPCGSGDGGGGC